MRLFTSSASPFVRKVQIVAAETGQRLELSPVVLSPVAPNAELSSKNPLGKIPALELDDGTVIFDSRVICEYLDGLHAGPRLIPNEPAARVRVLTTQALADGVLDAGILLRYETFLRPEPLRWGEWMDAQGAKVTGGLAALEATADSWGETLDLGQIAVGCAIGWLEFRRPLDALAAGPVDLRARFPKLMARHDAWRARPSFASTEPS